MEKMVNEGMEMALRRQCITDDHLELARVDTKSLPLVI